MFINFLTVLFTVILMEAFAWFTHKFIMHGFMWNWHQSHHSKAKTVFERNDLFGIIFGIVSCSFIVYGSLKSNSAFFYIGIGVLIYGFFYFLFHDILVHQRVKFDYSTKNKYVKRIIKAHHIHHRTNTKNGAEAFGFLYAHKKYASKRL